jgi:hypothetical protein
MLCGLLLKDLTIPAFSDDLHRIIHGCGSVESTSESFAYDRVS